MVFTPVSSTAFVVHPIETGFLIVSNRIGIELDIRVKRLDAGMEVVDTAVTDIDGVATLLDIQTGAIGTIAGHRTMVNRGAVNFVQINGNTALVGEGAIGE